MSDHWLLVGAVALLLLFGAGLLWLLFGRAPGQRKRNAASSVFFTTSLALAALALIEDKAALAIPFVLAGLLGAWALRRNFPLCNGCGRIIASFASWQPPWDSYRNWPQACPRCGEPSPWRRDPP